MKRRCRGCDSEKSCILIRRDIIESTQKLHDAVGDTSVRDKALGLIELEDDVK